MRYVPNACMQIMSEFYTYPLNNLLPPVCSHSCLVIAWGENHSSLYAHDLAEELSWNQIAPWKHKKHHLKQQWRWRVQQPRWWWILSEMSHIGYYHKQPPSLQTSATIKMSWPLKRVQRTVMNWVCSRFGAHLSVMFGSNITDTSASSYSAIE